MAEDHFLCSGCASIPRERALMQVIKDYYPNYKLLKIHESSPGGRGASVKLRNECPGYSSSHFYPDLELVRLAVPRRVYTNTHLRYVCDALEEIRDQKESIKGLRMTYEAPVLRHFTARFEEVKSTVSVGR